MTHKEQSKIYNKNISFYNQEERKVIKNHLSKVLHGEALVEVKLELEKERRKGEMLSLIELKLSMGIELSSEEFKSLLKS